MKIKEFKRHKARCFLSNRVLECSNTNQEILLKMNECGVIDKLTDALMDGYTIRFDSTPKTLAASLVMPPEG